MVNALLRWKRSMYLLAIMHGKREHLQIFHSSCKCMQYFNERAVSNEFIVLKLKPDLIFRVKYISNHFKPPTHYIPSTHLFQTAHTLYTKHSLISNRPHIIYQALAYLQSCNKFCEDISIAKGL